MVTPPIISWRTGAWLLSGILLLLQVGFIANGMFMGDYWEHRAVLKELMLHPLAPRHPIVETTVPHAFYSPYHMAWALLGKATGCTAATLLAIMAVANLLLLLMAVWRLARLLYTGTNHWQHFTMLLLILLCGWGIDPPNFSSFYHLNVLFYVSAYPSTFCISAAILSASLLQQWLVTSSRSWWQLPTVVLLLWLVLLTHPFTYLLAVALFVLLLTRSLAEDQERTAFLRSSIVTALLLAIPFVLVLLWPYFSLYQLLSYVQAGNQVHADSRELYDSIYLELYPLLLCLPLLVGLSKQQWRQLLPYVAAGALLLIIAVYGFVTGSYGFGRSIVFMVLLAQAGLVQLLLWKRPMLRSVYAAVLLVACLPFILASGRRISSAITTSPATTLQQPLHQPFDHTPPQELGQRLRFLEPFFVPGDVVLADTVCIRYLPGLGARVTASVFPPYWIADNKDRMEDIKHFFYTSTATNRTAIVAKWQPRYLLLTPTTGALLPSVQHLLEPQPVAAQNGITLYRFRQQ